MAAIGKGRVGAGNDAAHLFEYFVLTVGELDRLVYKKLRSLKAAKDLDEKTGQYTITNPEKAKSEYILPKILNPLGRQGWRLCAVNKMECYIFIRPAKGRRKKYEYKVLTPTDLDRAGIELLQKEGGARIDNESAEMPVVEITDPIKARIQNVLPRILQQEAAQGWELAAINGPQLHFLVREVR